jgi:hypothetical protein
MFETKKVTTTSLLLLPFFSIDVVAQKATTLQMFDCIEGDKNKLSPYLF